MICSCIVPSYGRPLDLFAMIHTLRESGNPDNFEILIRLDEDDVETLKYKATFFGFNNVRLVVGKKLGYSGFSQMCAELVEVAKGKWCWFLTDDCIIGGRNFDEKMARIPTDGFIVQPEISRLGGSIYPRWEGSNFPAAPREAVMKFGCNLTDTGLDDCLRNKHGWKTAFLEGITAWHLQ